MPKTRIICTLGPVSSNATMIRKMMRAGMDVVRLNFSHGDPLTHKACIITTRRLNEKYNRHVRVLQDLEGNRIRIGLLKGHKPIELKSRQIICLTQGDIPGDEKIISFDYPRRLKPVKPGHHVYIDDGNISLIVKEVGTRRLKAQVERGGILREHKGVNIPEARLEFPLLSGKDKKDILFGIENNVDYIAQSFVNKPEDVLCIRTILDNAGSPAKLIAKIESRQGIKHINEIIEVSDGIMIARGDMGISVPLYEIPLLQKFIIKKCNQARKFVITATQMLESMTENVIPTRAEVTDVANAILDGTDFIMLSAETAIGRYPVETVRMMNDIVNYTERHGIYF